MTDHVYFNGYDWLVAGSMDHLRQVFEDIYGGSWADYYDDDSEWAELPDDKMLTIFWRQEDWPPPVEGIEDRGSEYPEGSGEYTVSMTAKEWAEVMGPGLLCSTEY